MYRISLKDVGPDRVSKDVTGYTDIVKEALYLATAEFIEILGYTDFVIGKIADGAYVITHYNILIGSFTITQLN